MTEKKESEYYFTFPPTQFKGVLLGLGWTRISLLGVDVLISFLILKIFPLILSLIIIALLITISITRVNNMPALFYLLRVIFYVLTKSGKQLTTYPSPSTALIVVPKQNEQTDIDNTDIDYDTHMDSTNQDEKTLNQGIDKKSNKTRSIELSNTNDEINNNQQQKTINTNRPRSTKTSQTRQRTTTTKTTQKKTNAQKQDDNNDKDKQLAIQKTPRSNKKASSSGAFVT